MSLLGILGHVQKLGVTLNGAVLQRAGTHDGEVHWNLTLPGKERGVRILELHFFGLLLNILLCQRIPEYLT